MERSNRFLEAVAMDKPHRIKGAAGSVVTQAIDGNDPWMLQLAGDLGFLDKSGSAVRFVGVAILDLLQRHRAVELLVECDRDLAQAALGVGPEDAEPGAGGCGGPQGGWGDRAERI